MAYIKIKVCSFLFPRKIYRIRVTVVRRDNKWARKVWIRDSRQLTPGPSYNVKPNHFVSHYANYISVRAYLALSSVTLKVYYCHLLLPFRWARTCHRTLPCQWQAQHKCTNGATLKNRTIDLLDGRYCAPYAVDYSLNFVDDNLVADSVRWL